MGKRKGPRLAADSFRNCRKIEKAPVLGQEATYVSAFKIIKRQLLWPISILHVFYLVGLLDFRLRRLNVADDNNVYVVKMQYCSILGSRLIVWRRQRVKLFRYLSLLTSQHRANSFQLAFVKAMTDVLRCNHVYSPVMTRDEVRISLVFTTLLRKGRADVGASCLLLLWRHSFKQVSERELQSHDD